jgi:hypothetical protein
MVLVVYRNRLENWFLALNWLQGPDYCPIIGHNPGLYIIGLLTEHNTLRIYLYVMGLSNNPTCRKCGIEEETSVHILCEYEASASLRHAHLGSFCLDPEGIRKRSIGVIWNYRKEQGSSNLVTANGAQRVCFNTLRTGDANLRFLHYNYEWQMTQICLLTRAWFLRT